MAFLDTITVVSRADYRVLRSFVVLHFAVRVSVVTGRTPEALTSAYW